MITTMKTNMDYSAHSATGLGGAVRRATMLLLMMLLTATTAWAFKAETTAYSMTFNCSTEFAA